MSASLFFTVVIYEVVWFPKFVVAEFRTYFCWSKSHPFLVLCAVLLLFVMYLRACKIDIGSCTILKIVETRFNRCNSRNYVYIKKLRLLRHQYPWPVNVLRTPCYHPDRP